MKNIPAILTLSILALAIGCSDKTDETTAQAPLETRPLVRVVTLEENVDFEDIARVQGTVRTKYSVSVASRLSGTIDELMADEGDSVKKDQPLFQVDKVNLENNVRIAKDDLNVAKAMQDEAKAALEEAQAAYDKAKIDADRMESLYKEKQAVTKDTWEKATLQLKSSAASLSRAKAGLQTATVKITQAETGLQIAEKNLSDSLGKAPFDGIITVKMKEQGDFASAGAAIFTMDDPSIYEICFSMNADQYDKIKLNETVVRLADDRELKATYRSPSVNSLTRTFEMRAVVERTPDLAPGMIRNASVIFSSHKGAGVPTSAVGLRGGEMVAFVVNKEAVVEQVPVKTGATGNGRTEILNPDALKGAQIVKDGMLLLNPGDRVRPTTNGRDAAK